MAKRINKSVWNKLPKVKAESLKGDFAKKVAVIRKTPKGNLRVYVKQGEFKNTVNYAIKIARKVVDGHYIIRFPGSERKTLFIRKEDYKNSSAYKKLEKK